MEDKMYCWDCHELRDVEQELIRERYDNGGNDWEDDDYGEPYCAQCGSTKVEDFVCSECGAHNQDESPLTEAFNKLLCPACRIIVEQRIYKSLALSINDLSEREKMACDEAHKQYKNFNKALEMVGLLEDYVKSIKWGNEFERQCAFEEGGIADKLKQFRKIYPKHGVSK